MKFDTSLLYKKRIRENTTSPQIKGEYQAKYYKSEDKWVVGYDGQHVRFTNNDFCSVVEIFPVAKKIDERYNDYFQKSYGKVVLSSKNILDTFKIKVHKNIYKSPLPTETTLDNSLNLMMGDYNVMYSEKSPYKLQNMVLGNEIVKVLDDMLDLMKTMSTDISMHVHPNTAKTLVWRTESIERKINTIKQYLPNILSINNFVN